MATIDKSLAVGARRTYARNDNKHITENLSKLIPSGGGKTNFERLLKINNVLCSSRRRPSAPGISAGRNLIYIDHEESGELFFVFDMVNKRGELLANNQGDLLPGSKGRMLMSVSLHAVESLYQRLKTLEWKALKAELDPVGEWLMDNEHVIPFEKEGYLVTPNGVFPVLHGDKRFGDTSRHQYHWLATTWISQANLEDHTPHKRRVAEAVRAASGKGVQFVKLASES